MLKNILNKLTYKDNLTFISCFFKTASLPDKQNTAINKKGMYCVKCLLNYINLYIYI